MILGRKYFINTENYLDLILVASSVICSPYLLIHDFQKVVGIIAMIACCLDFMIFTRRRNIYIMMFQNVLIKVLKLFFLYFVLILGFCFVFDSIQASVYLSL